MDPARFPGKRSEVSKRRDRLGDDPDCGGRTAQIRQRLWPACPQRSLAFACRGSWGSPMQGISNYALR